MGRQTTRVRLTGCSPSTRHYTHRVTIGSQWRASQLPLWPRPLCSVGSSSLLLEDAASPGPGLQPRFTARTSPLHPALCHLLSVISTTSVPASLVAPHLSSHRSLPCEPQPAQLLGQWYCIPPPMVGCWSLSPSHTPCGLGLGSPLNLVPDTLAPDPQMAPPA